ncbi:MAG: hypothetical protein GY883_15465 [Shimia sp.]|nr:hypothetical protein [Shimia sp.]
MPSPHSSHVHCLAYVTDQAQFPLALFAAQKAASVCDTRDFDILICTFDPITIPAEFAALGIRNEVLPLREKLSALNLRLKWLPLEVYLRLWLPEMLGHRYRRILYADTDTYLCSSDLGRLFDVDMGPHEIAGVRDVHQWLDIDAPVNDFKALGLPGDKFLNSGVLLLDTKRFLASGLLDRLLDINASDTPTVHHDQSLLNLALRGNWTELNPVWNWQWMNRYPYFSRQANPQMLHFCGPKKPWRAHQKKTRFSPELIREYQSFLNLYGGDFAFRTWLPGGRRMPIWENLRAWHYARTHPEALERLIGRFTSPFDTLT